jgi:hypothetical protein
MYEALSTFLLQSDKKVSRETFLSDWKNQKRLFRRLALDLGEGENPSLRRLHFDMALVEPCNA